MKRKLLSVLLCLAMALSLLPTAALAEGEEVAKVGETAKYTTLAAALGNAQDGATVTLLANVVEDVVINKSITLDLGGKTLTNTNAGKATISVTGGTVTVKNGTVIGGTSYYNIEVTKNSNANLTLEGVTATAGNTGSSMIDNWGDLTINSGDYSGGLNVVKSEEGSTLNINGGKFTLDYATSGYTGVIFVYGTTTISGGEFIQSLTTTGRWNHPQVVATGVVEGYPAITKITGGTFTNNISGEGIFRGVGKGTSDNFEVSGGTFNKSISDGYCADGFIPTKNADGTYGVKEGKYVAAVGSKNYETLADAIRLAAKGKTVKLLADTRENVTIDKAMTLDLNGHTLNGGTVKATPALTITARVTVMDSSEGKTGTIMREDTAENSGVSSHYVIDIQGAGWLTFESGNVTNNSGNAEGKGASLVRVGDDSVAKYPGLNIKGGTFTQNNFIVIKVDSGDLFLNGGTLNSTDSYAIEDWHRATIKGGTVNGTVAAWTYSGGHNSTLTISGGTVNGDVESVSYDGAEGKLAKVEITGGTVNGTLIAGINNDSTTDPAKATIEITGGTFSSDPTKYVVEDSAVTKNDDGTYGVAKAYLAKVGETSYYTMDEAFKAQTASGKQIVLLRDYTTGSTFNSGSINRTVDLNGHTWTCTGTDANSAAFEINYANASLTVKNGKIVSSQLVGLIPSAMGGTIKYDNSSLTFENVEMSTTATSGIETNGNNTNDSVTLKNSTLDVPNGFGIYFPSSGTLTIDNSTINAKTMGVQVCAGSLSINAGSTITVSGDPVVKAENDGAIQDGAAISIVNRTGYKGLGKIEVTGGKFTAKDANAAIKAYNWENQTESVFDNSANIIAVSGGMFSSAVKPEYCAPGFVPKANSDGTYGVTRPSSGSSGSYDPTYSVSTPSKTENGTVTVSPKSASKGDTVTVTVKPDSGYVLETLTVTDKNGNELTLKDKGNGKYTFTMPAGKVEVKATFMEDNSMLNFFYDVPNGAYFYEAVKWAVENGITTGVGNDLFAPEQPCTRAQIVTFLWRAAGSPEPKGAASGMSDVVSGGYYEKAVAWAIENGITTGTTTSTFSPDVTCTRAQAVTFLARALKAKAASAAEFSDVPTDSYFADAVAWAAANGVTEGIGGGLFGSDNDCTRGQIVTFLYRAYNK